MPPIPQTPTELSTTTIIPGEIWKIWNILYITNCILLTKIEIFRTNCFDFINLVTLSA